MAIKAHKINGIEDVCSVQNFRCRL